MTVSIGSTQPDGHNRRLGLLGARCGQSGARQPPQVQREGLPEAPERPRRLVVAASAASNGPRVYGDLLRGGLCVGGGPAQAIECPTPPNRQEGGEQDRQRHRQTYPYLDRHSWSIVGEAGGLNGSRYSFIEWAGGACPAPGGPGCCSIGRATVFGRAPA